MESNIFYEKNKKYNCTKNGKPYFRKSVTIDGKRRVVYGDGEKDANKKIEELKNLSNAGLDLAKRDAKVGFAFKEWLYKIKKVDSKIKESTFSRYDTIFRVHVENNPIARKILYNLSSSDMQAYVTALSKDTGLSAAGVKNVVKLWKMFCSWALDEGYMVKNPCRNLVIPGKRELNNKEVETFTAEERKRIMDYMRQTEYQYDTLIVLAFATGMRLGELLGLMWEDVEDDHIHVCRSTAIVPKIDDNGNKTYEREVWDTKTVNSVRNIPVRPNISAMLKEHKLAQMKYFMKHGIRPEYPVVFTTESGQMIDTRNFTRSFHRLLDRAGVPYRKFHSIRHTFATEAIRRGVDVKDLQMLLGHSDIQVTYNVYVHSNDDSKRVAIDLIGDMM